MAIYIADYEMAIYIAECLVILRSGNG